MKNKKQLDEDYYKKNKEEQITKWYSDEIWGKKIQDDNILFEVMSLQIFQAGLTWKSTLLRRDEFRVAFNGWRIEEVALFDSLSVAKTGRKLDLKSDARFRFERGIDPYSIEWGIDAASKMILELLE